MNQQMQTNRLNPIPGHFAQPSEDARVKDIERELGELDGAIRETQGLLSDLGTRLSSVLNAQERPTGERPPEPKLCPLADILRDKRKMVESANQAVRDILNALEL